jgi:hypothetical protein
MLVYNKHLLFNTHRLNIKVKILEGISVIQNVCHRLGTIWQLFSVTFYSQYTSYCHTQRIPASIWITFRALSQVQVYWNWRRQHNIKKKFPFSSVPSFEYDIRYGFTQNTNLLLGYWQDPHLDIYIYICKQIFFILWRNSPNWAQAASM